MFTLLTKFTEDTILIVKNIPRGKVLTYGRIAKLAGSPRAARQVSWILHSSSNKYNLPWQRVINSKGIIALKFDKDKEYQKQLLLDEGVVFSDKYKIDLGQYQWNIDSIEKIKGK